jgi:creatinine amidohydrolase/Fe(II)-dependent formamide hydrolase-like protein
LEDLARFLELLGYAERRRLIVMPVASVENHGVLPAGSDFLIASCVRAKLATVLGDDAALAPVLAYSTAVEHEALGLTVGASPLRFIGFLEELLVSAARLAKEAVAVVTFHGGAYCPAYSAARSVRRREAARIVVENFWEHIGSYLWERYGIEPYVVHADPVEASLLLACGYSRGVKPSPRGEVVEEIKKRAERLRSLPRPWLGEDNVQGLYPGEPVPANKGLGSELLAAAVERLATKLSRLL